MHNVWQKTFSPYFHKENVYMYWLDEGGNIISSNQDDIQPGSFLGSKYADPQVFDNRTKFLLDILVR